MIGQILLVGLIWGFVMSIGMIYTLYAPSVFIQGHKRALNALRAEWAFAINNLTRKVVNGRVARLNMC